MQQNTLEERILYSLEETPWLFGAYLNQARHNLYICLNHLTTKLGGTPIDDDSQLMGLKAITILHDPNGKAKPNAELQQKAMDYYEKHLPFLFAMHYKYLPDEQKENKKNNSRNRRDKKPKTNISSSTEGYYDILTDLIKILNEQRNHYSHYHKSTQPPIDKKFIYRLNDVFDVNVRLVKRRFSFKETDYNHLIRLTKDRGKREPIANPDFRYNFFDKNKDALTQNGLVFFICLLLSKREAFLFLKKLTGFKDSRENKYKTTLEVFTINNIVLPKEKIVSDHSYTATFLDMANELSKCPKELYQVLSDSDRKKFITNSQQQEITTTDSSSEIEAEPQTKMTRQTNRFVYFAQRYLDATKAFQSLRFGVELGHLHYAMYVKEIAGEHVIRKFTRKLIGYGRLEDFDIDKRPKEFQELYINISQKENPQMQSYILETYPQYQQEENTIPVFMVNTVAEWPNIQLTPTTNKPYPAQLQKQAVKKPAALLSSYEMPALLFYQLLVNKEGATEKVISDHIKNTHSFFKDIETGKMNPVTDVLMPKPSENEIVKKINQEYNNRYNQLIEKLDEYKLKPAYIPERFLLQLLAIEKPGNEQLQHNAKLRLQKMIAESQARIDGMEKREKQESKPGKKSFRKIKVGKLAEFLAEDMLLMQPTQVINGAPQPSSKANSTAYRLLQSSLAYYGEHKNNLSNIFKACGLIKSNNQHPFLHKLQVLKYQGIVDFYKAYFEEKKKYLHDCEKKADYKNYYFLKLRNRDSGIRRLALEYLNESKERNSAFINRLVI